MTACVCVCVSVTVYKYVSMCVCVVPEREELEFSEQFHDHCRSASDLLVGDQVWNNLGQILFVGL